MNNQKRYESALEDAVYYERKGDLLTAISFLNRAERYTDDPDERYHLDLFRKRLQKALAAEGGDQ